MTSKELLKEIESWLSFNTEPSREVTAKLRKSIKDHLTEQLPIRGVVRFYLVSFDGEGSGSIWFNYDGFPSHLWIKEQITQRFPQVKTPAIMHIQELSEKDYKAFNCT